MFDKTIKVLEAALDLYGMRHAVINDNIANAETPNFKARRVDFEAALASAIEQRTDGETEKTTVQPTLYHDPLSEVGQDRNSVDMDREMAALTKNEVQYSAATQAVSKKLALLKFAIGGGNN